MVVLPSKLLTCCLDIEFQIKWALEGYNVIFLVVDSAACVLHIDNSTEIMIVRDNAPRHATL
jgi:hypothetical protein